MKNISKNNIPSPSKTLQENRGAPILSFFPSWLFFTENIAITPTLNPTALREQVLLQLESFAPIPPEQILSGFCAVAHEEFSLCYAAAKERLLPYLENLPQESFHALPAFALWRNDGKRTEYREWFATNDELTVLNFSPGNPFPTKISSWPISREQESDSEFYAKLNALRAEKQKTLPKNSEDKTGIYLLGEQKIDKKKQNGTIELYRLNSDGASVPAAKTLTFSLTDESLWLADIRDALTLSNERKNRKNNALAQRIKKILIAAFIIFLLLQIGLLYFKNKVSTLNEIANSQLPAVKEIQNQAKLIDEISKVQANKLQMIRIVAILNAHRPEGIGFTNFSGNGTTGTITITGNAETIAQANEFEKNIRSCGFFSKVNFSANMASNATNFSLQCTPDTPKINTINFFEPEETNTPSETQEDNPDGENSNVPAQDSEGPNDKQEQAPQEKEEIATPEKASHGNTALSKLSDNTPKKS